MHLKIVKFKVHLKIVKFKVHLNDGSNSVPECVVMLPANEANELDTVLLLGEVGGGIRCKDYDLILISLSCFVFHLSDFGICFDKCKHQIEQKSQLEIDQTIS